jgi:hypothetical protein
MPNLFYFSIRQPRKFQEISSREIRRKTRNLSLKPFRANLMHQPIACSDEFSLVHSGDENIPLLPLPGDRDFRLRFSLQPQLNSKRKK